MTIRKYRLRNNAIIEEHFGSGTMFDANGYGDDYKFIEYGNTDADKIKRTEQVEDRICLELKDGDFPIGGAHGKDFDIIEPLAL